MHIIHKVNNLEELKISLNYFKENNYAYISYITGEYGISNGIYQIFGYNFYLIMKNKGIKTVAFVFKDMKSFVYDCCDEIIEYQDIEFNDNTTPNNIINYIKIRNKNYEIILKNYNFSNLFYTLNCNGSSHYYNYITFDETFINKYRKDDIICLYKIDNNNIFLEPLEEISYEKYYMYKRPEIKRDLNIKTRNIAIWIRNTDKHPDRNTLITTYETVFNYCIENKIYCNVFLDIIPIELPNSEFIINKTQITKTSINWDNYIEIINNCDFFIGSDSGATEFILANTNINILYDRDLNYNFFKYLQIIVNKKQEDGIICKLINFPLEFNKIMDNYYTKK